MLDPAQNRTFRDHYLDVDFDLSDVMFITTANQLETIPEPLRDRMEIIQLDGYTEHEKLRIAQAYLVPRQRQANGLRPEEITFTDEALLKIARDYTREAGVRNLERRIGAICRKVAVQITSQRGRADRGDARARAGIPEARTVRFRAARTTQHPRHCHRTRGDRYRRRHPLH